MGTGVRAEGRNGVSAVRDWRQDAREAHRLVADLYTVRPAWYWLDLFASTVIGWSAFGLAVYLGPLSLLGAAAGLTAVLAIYRASIFIHELTHLRRRELPGFSTAWNWTVGAPLMLPSILYEGVHQDHHRKTTYGTLGDPEYVLLAGRPALIAAFTVASVFLPFLLALRFFVLAPISFVIPPFRRVLEKYASSFTINPLYTRSLRLGERRRLVHAEVMVLAFWAPILFAIAVGYLTVNVLFWWAGLFAGVCLINQIRTLAAHRYRTEGKPQDHGGQLLDSIDTPGGVWTELWAPMGLRYHALHHLLPRLPYHNLGQAYRRLIDSLPADSHYRSTHSPSLRRSLAVLWKKPTAEPSVGMVHAD